MDKYKKIFSKLITEEMGPGNDSGPTNVSPQKPDMSDGDAWNQANRDIADDESLNSQFEVEGLPIDITEEYVTRIQGWRQNIEEVADKIEEIYTFATENADKPGAGEIFSSIGGLVEGIMTDFGTLNGQLRSLGNKIKVAMKRDQAKGKR